MILADLQKAFYKLDHETLIEKNETRKFRKFSY